MRSPRSLEFAKMVNYVSPDYLQPLSTTTVLPAATLKAIQEIEQQFALPTEKLQEIVDRFLWEFAQGLSQSENDHAFMYAIHQACEGNRREI